MIAIGLGANLNSIFGTPDQALRKCPDLFRKHDITIIDFSSIWKSAPVPISDQPWYHNAVCLIDTQQSPSELWETISKIEEDAGRVRSIKNEPRVLDLDILFYHDKIIESDLSIPHPRLHERAFVLYPLKEVAPNWTHPVTQKSLDDMIEQLPQQQIERLEHA